VRVSVGDWFVPPSTSWRRDRFKPVPAPRLFLVPVCRIFRSALPPHWDCRSMPWAMSTMRGQREPARHLSLSLVVAQLILVVIAFMIDLSIRSSRISILVSLAAACA